MSSDLNDEIDPSNRVFYDPVTILRPISKATGVNLDQLNFVTCLFLAFPIGFWFRHQFRDSPREIRSMVSAAIGFAMCYFLYGRAIAHLLIQGIGSYLLLKFTNSENVHRFVFVFAMGYLLLIHFYRWIYQKSYCLDVTGSMMVAVGKTTLLATAIHDGNKLENGKEEELTEGQKNDAVREVPNLLDFMSYMFNFQSVIVGPMSHYSTWSAFLDLKHVPIDPKTTRPFSPTKEALFKFEISLGIFIVYGLLGSFLPMSVTSDPEYNRLNLFCWWFWHMIASTIHRLPYYFSWIISDANCNISGFGFDGIEASTDSAKWSKTTNVRPQNVELGRNYKEMVENWNIWTVAWLRRVVYERIEGPYRTWAVYLTGAIWHGLAVGYYLSFATSALFTLAAATFRRCVRHHFLANANLKLAYDVFGIIISKFAIGYIHYPFYVLHLWPSIFMYRKLYLAPQIIAILIYLYLPMVLPPLNGKHKKKSGIEKKKSGESTKTAIDGEIENKMKEE